MTSVDAVNLDTGIATVQVAAPDQFEAATNALPHLVRRCLHQCAVMQK